MNAALYIHFPFCRKKCAYCDFFSIQEDQISINHYLKSLQREIDIHPIAKDFTFQTIYWGGGTPSLLSPPQIEIIFTSLFKNFSFNKEIEITIEINPETVSFEKLKDFHSLGINRLSIGIQSFNDAELKTLGRIHNAKTAIQCIKLAQKVGFSNINLDLIFAIPGQTMTSWENNLRQTIGHSPQHVSIYGLTIEQGTHFEQKITQGLLKVIDEILEREMYLKGVEILEANGLAQYEISNFTRSGYFSHHNQMYWDGNPYLGLGPAAHSFWENQRQWNVANVTEYIDMLKRNSLPIENTEQLTHQQQLIEFIFLSLRQKSGIDLKLFKEKFKFDFIDKYKDILEKIKSVNNNDLIQVKKDKLSLTVNGFLLYNEICSYFV